MGQIYCGYEAAAASNPGAGPLRTPAPDTGRYAIAEPHT